MRETDTKALDNNCPPGSMEDPLFFKDTKMVRVKFVFSLFGAMSSNAGFIGGCRRNRHGEPALTIGADSG
jgi:hypothetical protein